MFFAKSLCGGVNNMVKKNSVCHWYWTMHGIGPGMMPKGVGLLDTKEGPNNKGTLGDFILLDRELTDEEMNEYDLRDLSPDGTN